MTQLTEGTKGHPKNDHAAPTDVDRHAVLSTDVHKHINK